MTSFHQSQNAADYLYCGGLIPSEMHHWRCPPAWCLPEANLTWSPQHIDHTGLKTELRHQEDDMFLQSYSNYGKSTHGESRGDSVEERRSHSWKSSSLFTSRWILGRGSGATSGKIVAMPSSHCSRLHWSTQKWFHNCCLQIYSLTA